MIYHVDPSKASLLNLREAPKPGVVLAAMPQGTRVEKLGEHPTEPLWWHVEAPVVDDVVTGFTHSRFLAEGEPPDLAEVDLSGIPVVHLKRNGKKRSQNGGRAFPLDESGMPSRGNGTNAQKARALIDIIDYLFRQSLASGRLVRTGGWANANN